MDNQKTVCAILTIYKRVDYLEKQILSLLAQTHKITEWIIRVNDTNRKDEYLKIMNRLIPDALVIESSKNTGVRSRFFIAFNAKSQYIFVVDDDIIPGSQWIENCLSCMKEKEGIYGSRGSIFRNLKVRKDRDIISETSNRPRQEKRVDISGHSRFFKKDALFSMFDLLPEVDYPTAGEELRISYRASLYALHTYIPPMSDDIETRGNKEPTLGHDNVANYNTQKNKYQEFYEYAIRHGYKPMIFE